MSAVLAVVSGILTSLSMPGMISGFLVWFSLVPLLIALEREKPMRAGLNTMLFFFTHLMITHFWLFGTLTRNMPLVLGRYPPHLGLFVFILFGLYESIFMFPLGFAMALFKPKGIESGIFFASLYTLLEKLRELGDMGYTGGRLSDALYTYTSILQITKITGELGLVFVVAFVNFMIFHVLKRREYTKALIYLSAPILISTFFKPFMPPPELKNPLVIRAHQTSYDPASKYNAPMEEKLRSMNPGRETIYVLPESFFVRKLDGIIGEISKLSEESGSMIVLGALDISERPHNSVFFFKPDGSIDRYDKVKLFPFVEFLPYPRLFSFLRFLRGLSYYEPGRDFKVVEWNGVKVGAQICFESYFESVSRNLVENGAEMIFVLTNDGWFESDVALKQHFAKAVLRAVENGRWVVQVANKGITGVIDQNGNVVQTLQIGVEKIVDFQVQPLTGRTFYTEHPNFTIYISFILLGISLVLRFIS